MIIVYIAGMSQSPVIFSGFLHLVRVFFLSHSLVCNPNISFNILQLFDIHRVELVVWNAFYKSESKIESGW